MTTTPERLTSHFLFRVLESILAQKTSCLFKIVLFIPFRSLRTGISYPDPVFLSERYGKEQLVIHRCDDMGPATKFTGLLTYLPLVDEDVTHIYSADDDIILRDHVFQRMLETLHERCTERGCRLFQRMLEMLRVRRSMQDYHRLVLANDAGSVGGMATVAGYAGILAPLGFFRDLAADDRLAPVWADLAINRHPCFNVDDMLLSKLFQRFNYPVEGTGLNPFTDVMDRALTDQHPEWFELCKHTPRDDDTIQCLNVLLP
ncbi:MAG: glycosyltransferase [Geobacteraceae bacterium]|nr:glycosyltransferase [Geobacteraceae bacterium]